MTPEPDEGERLHFLRRAIELGRRGALELGTGGPFGAVVARDGVALAEGFNRVVVTRDPTWHAEMEAIRTACAAVVGHFKIEGAVLYASGEPCPMCLAAAYWAGIGRIYYASTRDDAAAHGGFGDADYYRELALPAERRALPVRLEAAARDEALAVWRAYAGSAGRVAY
jgi:tRNA(Arg) A34 adenosine deaminase TadA